MQPLTAEACRSLAITLVAAKRGLDLEHPMGRFHENWTYESATVTAIRELLGVEAPNIDRWNRSGPVLDIDALDALPLEDVRKLVALLMTHHLRVAGKVDGFLQDPIDEPLHAAGRGNAVTDAKVQQVR